MKTSYRPALFFFASLLSLSLVAQEEKEKPSLDSGPIDSRFEYVIEESNNYQQYEVIPKDWMATLRSHVTDTLQAMRSDLTDLRNELEQREENIASLEGELEDTRNTLEETRSAQDEMQFLGIPMDKTTYRIIMWSMVGFLFLLLLVFIYRFNRSNAVTRQSTAALASVQEELEQHRKRSLEREQKLRRELQDELNKQRRQKDS